MISKKQFEDFIVAIKKQRDIDNKATDALDIIFEDIIGGFYRDETLFSVIESFLIKDFEDKEEWILYFMYELDFGKKWKEGCCTEKDINGHTVDIDISTVGHLYDFLIKNMKKLNYKAKELRKAFEKTQDIDWDLTSWSKERGIYLSTVKDDMIREQDAYILNIQYTSFKDGYAFGAKTK